MFSLLSILRKFWKIMKRGLDDPEFRGLAILLGGWLVLGTVIYSIYEGWSPIESLYFCFMTITTIGYGDYTPTGSIMQLYTIVYAALGIGLFVAFSARLVQFALQSSQDEGTTSAAADSA